MVNIADVKKITIPEGNVKSISVNGTTIWKKSRLPEEYQEVEYIKSTGTQHLDSGISCASGIKCQYKASFQVGGYICGSHALSSPYGRCGGYLRDDLSWELGYGNNYTRNGTGTRNTIYEVEYSTTYASGYLKVKGGNYTNWTTLISESGQIVSTLNALIFTQQFAVTYGQGKTSATLYYLKIYDNSGVLKGDFVPCYRKADNVVGLYNLVNNSFITNIGTGTLEKGGNV